MPWTVEWLEELRIIEITFEGMVSSAELRDMAREVMHLAAANGAHLYLADCSALQGGHSVFDLYSVASDFARAASGVVREAVIVPALSAPAEDVRFWEDTADNHGLIVRRFPDRESAMDWLVPPVTA
jgi:hypothetical protein